MPGARPCAIHAAQGEDVQSVWLITSQDDDTGFPPGDTYYVCWDCLVGLVVARMGQQLEERQEPEPEPAPDGGPDPEPAKPKAGKRGRTEPEPEPEPVEDAPAEAADVNR